MIRTESHARHSGGIPRLSVLPGGGGFFASGGGRARLSPPRLPRGCHPSGLSSTPATGGRDDR
jgi:hypothetical protein